MIKYLKDIPGLNNLYVDDLERDNNPSVFVYGDNYQVIIIRGLYIPEDEVKYKSYGFIHYEGKTYFYNRESKALEFLGESFNGLIKKLQPVYESNHAVIDQYVQEVDKLEDSLYERKISRVFMDIWFDLKKDILRIERFINRNHFVIKDFYKYNVKNDGFASHEFRDLIERIEQYGLNCANQIGRLDALQHYYTSVKNDKLNKNLYILTLLSAVFLPLNLIVGFFGMNTENLFFKDHPLGTIYVLGIISTSFLVSSIGLPFLRFLDTHILRLILGRYDMYKRFSKKLEKFFKVD